LPSGLVEDAVRELGYPNLTAAVIASLDGAVRARRIEQFIHDPVGPSPEAIDRLRQSRGSDSDSNQAALG
jgi:hypothetical protein